MIKWFKARTKQEKWMLGIILAMLIGIVLRWGFVKTEVGDAFKDRIKHFSPLEKTEQLPQTDSADWDAVRDSDDL